MRYLYLTTIVLFYCFTGRAQKWPDFQTLRFDEDYSFLRTDTSNNWYNNLKYTQLSKSGNAYVSFGGDIRFQYFKVHNEDWGEAPKDGDGYMLSRYLLHADLHAGKHFRAFAQLQSSMANGKAETSPVEEDPLELHQAFADYSGNIGAHSKLMVRVGRQELSYGSQRLISVREGPNNRQSFDAGKVIVTSGTVRADFFFSGYVAAKKGLFDDHINEDVKFWGSYFVVNKIPVVQNIDLYYLGLWKRNAVFDDGKGREERHSIGTRIWGKVKDWKYDLEAVYQFGDFGDKTINAWTASINATYKLATVPLKPELGLKAELISGDRQYGDNKLQTFNPLFPRGAYFGLVSVIGPANLCDLHPSISFPIVKQLSWTIDYDAFWRYSRNDGIYAPNVAMIYSGKNTTDKFIGHQLSTDLTYVPNKYLYFRGEFTWFKAGPFLKQAGVGKDILFVGVTTQFKI